MTQGGQNHNIKLVFNINVDCVDGYWYLLTSHT